MTQIGTIELETQNNGVAQVPVFDAGDSGINVYEMVRVQTDTGVGFIPVIEDSSKSAFPYIRIQTENYGVCVVHDRESLEPKTATTGYYSVSDNDTTTLNPQNIVPETDSITIQSAEIQWRGVEDTQTTTTTETVKKEVLDRATREDEFPLSASYTLSGDDTEFNLARTFVRQTDGGYIEVVSDLSVDGTLYASSEYEVDANGGDGSHVINPSSSNTSATAELYRAAFGPRDGEDFDLDAAGAAVEYYTEETTTTTTTYDTQNPSVSQDVSADAGNITLDDGVTSNWYTLSDLDPNSETFSHSINGSGKAEFRIRFNYY